MRKMLLVLGLMLSTTAFAAPSTIVKSGKCALREAGAFDKSKLCVIDLKNAAVQVVFHLRGDEFFGKFGIQTTPKITNLSGKPKHIAYNIAFFDKKGNLVACTSSSTDIEKDTRDLQAGSNMPEIPRTSLGKITSYQAVVYVTDGKK